jgi:hypothetical protein
MANTKNSVHPSASRLNNFAPEKGNDVDSSREHIQSGPQTASNHMTPAPAFKKVKPGK